MKPIHPALEFLGTLPQFQLTMGEHDWCAVELRHGTVVSPIDSDEPKFRDAIELRFAGSASPFRAELGPYLDLQVFDASRLLGLSVEEQEDWQEKSNSAWRRVQEGDWR